MTPATCTLCHISNETAPAAGLRAVVPGCARCALVARDATIRQVLRAAVLLDDHRRHAATISAAAAISAFNAGGDLPAGERPLLTGEELVGS